MNKAKKYLKNHPEAIMQDYENQRHQQHVIQACKGTYGKHDGSKRKKTLMYHINRIQDRVTSFIKKYNG